jgi:hypothetical protein
MIVKKFLILPSFSLVLIQESLGAKHFYEWAHFRLNPLSGDIPTVDFLVDALSVVPRCTVEVNLLLGKWRKLKIAQPTA